jgi:1,4-alpha-glucan branching enzyme
MAKTVKTPKTNIASIEAKPEPVRAQGPATAALQTLKPVASRISLQLVNPTAQKVCVAGSFNGWKPEAMPLTRAGNGQWVGDVNVKPGRHEYLFVVDGQWLPDPKATETVPNPFGGRNSVLVVSE